MKSVGLQAIGNSKCPIPKRKDVGKDIVRYSKEILRFHNFLLLYFSTLNYGEEMNFANIIAKIDTTKYECCCLECNKHYVTYLDKRSTLYSAYCPSCRTFPKNQLTQQNLRKFFNYNPVTGELSRRLFSGVDTKIGEVIGCVNNTGYVSVSIAGKRYLLHRIIWLYVYGHMPDCEIDHIDHNRTNNRLSNLRLVSSLDNKKNTSLSKNNSTGYNGVSLHKPTGKYRAYIMVDRKQIHLGLYETLNEAVTVRKQAELKYGFHYNHGK